MVIERREFTRYEPIQPLDALLVWQDQAEQRQSLAVVNDLSQGGCALCTLDAPLVGELALVRLCLNAGEPPETFQGRVLARTPREDALRVSIRFEQVAAEQIAQLQTVLASDAFQPQRVTVDMTLHRKHWRAPQWAAFLTAQHLPVMPRSKQALLALEAQAGAEPSAHDLAVLVGGDPFLCLCLLREAENRRTTRLGHETSTPLAAVMQIGSSAFRELLLASPETDDARDGLARCERRAVIAGELAAAWSTARADVSPGEVAMAALLSEIGELMLWHFAPELPQAALDTLTSGEAKRTAAAQEATCGFKFKDLTLKCAELWKLPAILVQLIHGQNTVRANLAGLCRDTARHLVASPDNPALPDDLATAKRLIPNASLEWLVDALKWVPEELRLELLEKARAAYDFVKHEVPP